MTQHSAIAEKIPGAKVEWITVHEGLKKLGEILASLDTHALYDKEISHAGQWTFHVNSRSGVITIDNPHPERIALLAQLLGLKPKNNRLIIKP